MCISLPLSFRIKVIYFEMTPFLAFYLQTFTVTLTKGDKGLGFTVAGGQQTVGLFYVKDVLFDPALSDGTIQRGDRLVAVSDGTMQRGDRLVAVSDA